MLLKGVNMANLRDLSYYTGLVTPEHRKPRFLDYLSAFLTKIDINTLVSSFDVNFDIDTAVGVQLDILGEYVGQGRTVNFNPTNGSSATLDDYYYRFLLKGKIIENLWDGTMETLIELLDFVFPGTSTCYYYYNVANFGISQRISNTIDSRDFKISVVDNQDMTMTVYIQGNMPSIYRDLIEHGYIIPKPQSVGVNFVFVTNVIFGYDYDSDTVSGYDKGYWYLDF
jgi:hypothetical protein